MKRILIAAAMVACATVSVAQQDQGTVRKQEEQAGTEQKIDGRGREGKAPGNTSGKPDLAISDPGSPAETKGKGTKSK